MMISQFGSRAGSHGCFRLCIILSKKMRIGWRQHTPVWNFWKSIVLISAGTVGCFFTSAEMGALFGKGQLASSLEPIARGLKEDLYDGVTSLESVYRPDGGTFEDGFRASVPLFKELFG